ncbi:MAG: phospholipase D family protein [Ignavibacteriales bacterium]
MSNFKIVIIVLLVLITVCSLYGLYKPLPKGISYEGKIHKIQNIKFLHDLTYIKDGKLLHEQEIFNTAYRIIEQADKFIIIDMFLFNSDYDKKDISDYPKLPLELTQKLIEKKKSKPDIKIFFITDKINTGYGSYQSKYLEELKRNNIEVVITDLSAIRDSNPIYSGFWRGIFQWFNIPGKGWLPNPFASEAPKFKLYSYLDLLNFKANHRKIVCSENEALISSGNPHEPSGFHSNIAFAVKGEIINDIVESEKAVVSFSGKNMEVDRIKSEYQENDKNIEGMLVTEGKIKDQLLNEIRNSTSDDSILIGVFYLGDRDIVRELISAAVKRGTQIKIILDKNLDAFGRKKIGIPNTEVANELLSKSNNKIQIRWYNTHGEQYHSKMAIFARKTKTVVIGGSANFTRRNLCDYNLETDLKITTPADSDFSKDALSYFDRMWNNKNGSYTIRYDEYKNSSTFKTILYRIQEGAGLSSF